ncbi:hypothetical protein [Streptomyces griseoviridis]|uniref:hypothetical protein n=1 Tax=Streptomyces griseoviridis TaxID=45398 RepID=UPI003456F834
MSATERSALVRAALVGAATGLRSQWGAAAVAWSSPPDARAGPAGRDAVRAGPWLRGATATAALAEFVADKSPRAPSRLAPAGLGPRMLFGAVSGAVLARRHRPGTPVAAAAATGVAAAVLGAVAGARWRGAVGGRVTGAVAEDAVTALLAWAACAPGRAAPAGRPSTADEAPVWASTADGAPVAGQVDAVPGYEVRAQYAAGSSRGSALPRVEVWHMTSADATHALCGERIAADAETQPVEKWGTAATEPFCRLCGTHFLRQGL